MKIGFIGCGNMGRAIVKGILSAQLVNSNEINIFDLYKPAMENIKNELNINTYSSSTDVVDNSDIIFLAVKPNVLSNTIKEINNSLKNGDKLIISIAAGKTINFIRDSLTHNNKIVRVMPNINATVKEAISAYCSNDLVTDDDKEMVEKLLSSFGKCMALDESFFPLFGVLGGCTPAFAYMFIDSLARAGVKNGMKKADALKIAAQSVYGSAKMILESDVHPWTLVDNVCSPGGTTIEGVTSLQADGFESAVENAVNKAIEKDSKL